MLFRLLLLFTLMPLIELAVMIKVGQHIGVLPTIAMILAAGFLGAALARHEGLRTLRAVQEDLAAGRLPHDRLIDALLILVAGVLLIAPGFVTDLIALLLLISPVRILVRKYLKKRFAARFSVINMNVQSRRDDFIDVEARPVDEPDRNRDNGQGTA
jgi:UPF0716 protein FxsA